VIFFKFNRNVFTFPFHKNLHATMHLRSKNIRCELMFTSKKGKSILKTIEVLLSLFRDVDWFSLRLLCELSHILTVCIKKLIEYSNS